MKLFSCSRCQQSVFFESVECVNCGQSLAFVPERALVCAMEPVQDRESAARSGPAAGQGLTRGPAPSNDPGSENGGSGSRLPPALGEQQPAAVRWRAVGDANGGTVYRPCRNHLEHAVCNWAVRDDDPNPYCLSCRLNHVIPPLDSPEAIRAWHELETAKRRVLYTLYQLRIPVEGKSERPNGLEFNFKRDSVTPDEPHVVTGHADGVITINAAEADDAFREKVRTGLGETYRTVLGHLRHEIGHYYWEKLIAGGPRLPAFRAVFGDEQQDYAEAQRRHYGQGAPPDWPSHFVSAYASMHPWEDWAETWAHYLHLTDTLETARSYGLSLQPRTQSLAGAKLAREAAVSALRIDVHDFDELIAGWIPLTVALNNLNRSMGMRDSYPFVLSGPAIEKLRFVHEAVSEAAASTATGPTAAAVPLAKAG